MAYLNSRPRTPAVCPVCGEDVPKRALACPECGADHQSGWKAAAYHGDGLDLPEEEGAFDYDDFVKKEFGRGLQRSSIKPLWWITAAILLAIFVGMALSGR